MHLCLFISQGNELNDREDDKYRSIRQRDDDDDENDDEGDDDGYEDDARHNTGNHMIASNEGLTSNSLVRMNNHSLVTVSYSVKSIREILNLVAYFHACLQIV